MAVLVKITLPIQEIKETHVRSLGGEDPLEEGMATQPSILAWRIPQTKESGGQESYDEKILTRLRQLSMRAPSADW